MFRAGESIFYMVLLVSIYIRLLSTHSETGEYSKAQTSHSEISQLTTTTLRRPKCSIINWFIFIFPCPLHAIAFKTLSQKCFIQTSMLRFLSLQKNKINNLDLTCFKGLFVVRHIDLSFNRLSFLSGRHFKENPQLIILDIRQNPLSSFEIDFTNPKLKVLLVDFYFICCYTNKGHTNCTARPSAISSCDDLLSSIPMKILIWIIGTFSFTLNTINIVVRLFPHYPRTLPLDYNIISISLGDSMLGTYLLIIGIADTIFRGTFAGSQKYWQSSALCMVAACLYFLSANFSVAELSILNTIKFLSVYFPFYTRINIHHSVFKFLLIHGVLLLLATICTTFPYFLIYKMAPNSICMLITFGNDNQYLAVITILISTFQIFGICLNTVLFIAICRRVIASSHDISKHGGSSLKIKQMSIVMVSNILCWLPSSVLFLITMHGHQISPSLLAWNVATVIPINATINGFTFSCFQKDFRMFLKIKTPNQSSVPIPKLIESEKETVTSKDVTQ